MEDDVSTNKVGLGLLYHYKWRNCRKRAGQGFYKWTCFQRGKRRRTCRPKETEGRRSRCRWQKVITLKSQLKEKATEYMARMIEKTFGFEGKSNFKLPDLQEGMVTKV